MLSTEGSTKFKLSTEDIPYKDILSYLLKIQNKVGVFLSTKVIAYSKN